MPESQEGTFLVPAEDGTYQLFSTDPALITAALEDGTITILFDGDIPLGVLLGTYEMDGDELIFIPNPEIPLGFMDGTPVSIPWWLGLLALLPFLFFLLFRRRKVMVELVVNPRKKSYYQILTRGEKLSNLQEEIKKDGYLLNGWYTKDEQNEDYLFDFNEKIRKDITLYAYWRIEDVFAYLDETAPVAASADTEPLDTEYDLDGILL